MLIGSSRTDTLQWFMTDIVKRVFFFLNSQLIETIQEMTGDFCNFENPK